MATKQLSEHEIKTLTGFQQEENDMIVKLGQIEYQIAILESQKDVILDSREQFTQRKQQFGVILQEKYGDGNINLETGEITTID